MLVTVSLVRDDTGRPLSFISQVQDISERKAQKRRLNDLVDHDFLTRLFNRRRFEQELAKEARLKIDGEFVRNLTVGSVDQLVVKALVGIAKGMGKKTVADFIENVDVTRLLRDSGVDFGQGYHLGRPQPVGELLLAT